MKPTIFLYITPEGLTLFQHSRNSIPASASAVGDYVVQTVVDLNDYRVDVYNAHLKIFLIIPK